MRLGLGLSLTGVAVLSRSEEVTPPAGNLFTDPGFDNSGAWTLGGSNRSISGSVLNVTGSTNASAYQIVSELTPGSYDYSFDLGSYGGLGSIRFRFWNSGGTILASGAHQGGPDGNKTGTVTVPSGCVRIGVSVGSDTVTCTIDNITCEPA